MLHLILMCKKKYILAGFKVSNIKLKIDVNKVNKRNKIKRCFECPEQLDHTLNSNAFQNLEFECLFAVVQVCPSSTLNYW